MVHNQRARAEHHTYIAPVYSEEVEQHTIAL